MLAKSNQPDPSSYFSITGLSKVILPKLIFQQKSIIFLLQNVIKIDLKSCPADFLGDNLPQSLFHTVLFFLTELIGNRVNTNAAMVC